MYDFAVVGLGLIGSAAFRHLVEMGHRVVGIGPSEPKHLSDRDRIFASYYDQGRITRVIDPSPFWAMAGKRSLDAYADLEQRSGIHFHKAVGCLRVSADIEAEDDTLFQAEANGKELGADYRLMTQEQFITRCPFLHMPEGSRVVFEQGGAGYVNPRSLVSAQLVCAMNSGGSILRTSVADVQSSGSTAAIKTVDGEEILAENVLITNGAWCNMLMSKPLALRPRPATILLAAIDDREAQRLASMPAIIYRLKDHPQLYSIYALPPIRYPDGKTYLKIGGTFHQRVHLPSIDALDAWFHTSGDEKKGKIVGQVLRSLLPGLRIEHTRTVPCVVTYTEHDHPYIDRLAPNVTIGVGGNGAAAKSSNEIGRIAALASAHVPWTYDYDQSLFAAVYA